MMARIGNDRMITHGEQREDNSWLFTVCYTAYFSDDELGQRFDDLVIIRELRGQRIAGAEQAVTFTATSPRVFRKKRIVVHQNSIESMCALIRLQRVQSEAVDDEQRTPALVSRQSVRC